MIKGALDKNDDDIKAIRDRFNKAMWEICRNTIKDKHGDGKQQKDLGISDR